MFQVLLLKVTDLTIMIAPKFEDIYNNTVALFINLSLALGTNHALKFLKPFRSYELAMDPLSDVLSLLQPHNQYYAGFDAAGDWSFNFPPYKDSIKFMAITKGSCWGMTEDSHEPIQFNAGDCILLNSGSRLILSSQPGLETLDGEALAKAAANDGLAIHNGGGDVFIISGLFSFKNSHVEVLLDALPSLISISKATEQAEVIRWSLTLWAQELKNKQPGGALVATHMAHLMLVQVLRLYLETSKDMPIGWFSALTDKQISLIISAIHTEPEHNWTLAELARIGGLSRTVFAQRFKALVGSTAMEYVLRWRMLLAADRLKNTVDNIATIAFSLGYESESAFSTAFKRVMNSSPSQYRRKFITTD
ncbi:AraC family transcriptional regulator [Vibrio fluvialis]